MKINGSLETGTKHLFNQLACNFQDKEAKGEEREKKYADFVTATV